MKTDTALLIIDMQTVLAIGANPVYQLNLLLENISRLISQAHTTGTPIIYIQNMNQTN